MECLLIGRAEMKDDRCHRDAAGSESESDGARLGKGRRSPLLARKPNSTPYIVHHLIARNIGHFSRPRFIALWLQLGPHLQAVIGAMHLAGWSFGRISPIK